jgi:EmrB/QacA subfamily drug resistance transporter
MPSASAAPRSMVVPLIVACALFMENLDGTVITTALPAMAESFGTSPIHLSLGITVYMFSLGIFIPISGWVADRFGARTVFRAAIGVFTLGSILCGLTNGIVELALARIVQGIGGAMMVPVGRLVLLRSVEKTDLVRAMAYLTVPALVGPVLGPPVGGFITTFLSWRWIFFLNVPIGLLGMVLVTFLLEDQRADRRAPFDWLGFFLTGVALSAIMYDSDLVARPDVSGWVLWGLLALGLAVGLWAVLYERRQADPLVDLSLLRIPTFEACIWGGSIFRVAAGALPFLLPLLLQVGFGMSAFASGLLTCGSALGSFLMKLTTGPILRRFGFRRVLIGNTIISAGSLLVCAFFSVSTPVVLVFLLLLGGGFFRSLQYTCLNTLAYADIEPDKMSAATSFSSMMQQLSNGMGVAVGAILLHTMLSLRGASPAELGVGDVHMAFVAVTILCLLCLPFFLRLLPRAGAVVSGHGRALAAGTELEPRPSAD